MSFTDTCSIHKARQRLRVRYQNAGIIVGLGWCIWKTHHRHESRHVGWIWKIKTLTAPNQKRQHVRGKGRRKRSFLRQGWWWSAWVPAVKHMRRSSVTAAYIFLVQRESRWRWRWRKTTLSSSRVQWSRSCFYKATGWCRDTGREPPGLQTPSCLNISEPLPAGGDPIKGFFIVCLCSCDFAAVVCPVFLCLVYLCLPPNSGSSEDIYGG